jgi:predicted nucleotidyltransferase
MKENNLAVAKKIIQSKFTKADCAFLAGSTVRGDATEYSDLDIVVLFSSLESAWRESFIFDGWPVEVFVHDLETLNWFFENNRESNIPSLAQMVKEGILIGKETSISMNAKRLADTVFEKGPQIVSLEQLNNLRYYITDLVDDLRDCRNDSEMMSIGVRLYETLSEFIFRSSKEWSAKGKWISRRLKVINPHLEAEFMNVFDILFVKKDAHSLIQFSEKVLNKHGGFLFDGFKLQAKIDMRLPLGNNS